MTDLRTAARASIAALEAALMEPVHPAIPLENSREAADAIEATLAEYGHPTNPVNAARAGWRAARLYTAPLQPVGPVAWSHINGTSDTKWHPRPAEPVEDTDDKAASIRWQLCLLAQTEEFSDEVRNQIGRGVWLIDRLSAKLQEIDSASKKLPVPHGWHTELATTCFARSYGGEGSYYCPHCNVNAGSVWLDSTWRPTKWQAVCHKCRELFEEQQ